MCTAFCTMSLQKARLASVSLRISCRKVIHTGQTRELLKGRGRMDPSAQADVTTSQPIVVGTVFRVQFLRGSKGGSLKPWPAAQALNRVHCPRRLTARQLDHVASHRSRTERAGNQSNCSSEKGAECGPSTLELGHSPGPLPAVTPAGRRSQMGLSFFSPVAFPSSP